MEQSIAEKAIFNTKKSSINRSIERANEITNLSSAEIKSINSTKSSKEEKRAFLEHAVVEELNKTLAIVHTSSTYILIEKNQHDFVLDTKSSILTLYENQIVPELIEDSSKKAPTKAQIWVKSPRRRTFQNIVFNPQIIGHYDGNFNIWRGFAVDPICGDCSLFWDHLRQIICCGNETHYIYIRKWLAHLIQKPWVISTALVLRGKQGTGKGTFVTAIGKLLGTHYAPLASLDQIIGRFNSHLKNAILVFADEALWGGHKKEIGILKALITEPKMFLEGKGKDGYWIDNYKHLIISSNEDWVVHLDPDDRRFFVIDISSDKKEDINYFSRIQKQMDSAGYQALMYDLMQEDLLGYDPKIMPENYFGFDMKLQSASSTDKFIYTSLKEGCWDHMNGGTSYVLENLTMTKLHDYYKEWCKDEKQPLMGKAQFGKRLKEIIPTITTAKTSRKEDPKRPAIYLFPPIEECKSSFEKLYKQTFSIWEWS